MGLPLFILSGIMQLFASKGDGATNTKWFTCPISPFKGTFNRLPYIIIRFRKMLISRVRRYVHDRNPNATPICLNCEVHYKEVEKSFLV